MKKLLFLALLLPVLVVAATHTASWTAVTTYTDGSTITLPVTYNLYTGAKGKETVSQSGITTLSTTATLTDAAPCAEVTAVAGGNEGARSNEVCLQFTPSAPTLTLQ
jgi:hypothetical protein